MTTQRLPTLDGSRRFHIAAAIGCGLFFFLSIYGCWATLIDVRDMGPTMLGYSAFTAALSPLPAYWQQRRRTDLRDATLTIPWVLVFRLLIPFPFLVAARLVMPLQDDLLTRLDSALGYNASAVVTWAQHSHLGTILDAAYECLTPFLISAALIPAIFARPQAKTFLLANIIAATIALPCFTLVPAIGPWHSGSFSASALQLLCTHQITALRHLPRYPFSFIQGAAIVCFPSFHVIWAVLAASAFSGIRLLRIPAIILSAVIILSTLTTGWHYLADVIAGLFISALSLLLANRIITGGQVIKVSTPSEVEKDAEMEIA